MNNETTNKKRILIVDDDALYAGQVKEWLQDSYQVDAVTSGAQALRFLSMKKADLILLDYEMPEMDGPEVFRRLKENPETKNISIVFLTGVEEK